VTFSNCATICYLVTSYTLCLSVTRRSYIETAGRIEVVFATEAFFHFSYIVVKENMSIAENKGTSLWNFVLKTVNLKISLRQVDRVVNKTRLWLSL